MLELTRMDELHLGNTGRLTGHYQYASWEIQISNLVVCGASETVLQDKNWEGWADSETPVSETHRHLLLTQFLSSSMWPWHPRWGSWQLAT